MTEHEWLVSTDPEPMLEFLRGKASDRKLRLFACACCRHTSSIMDAEWRRMVDHERRRTAVLWPSRVFHWISSKFRPHWPDRSLLDWSKREAELAWRAAELAEKVADGLTDLTELKALLSSPGDDEMEGCYADGPNAAWAAKSSAYRARHCANYNSPCSYPPRAAHRAPSKPDHDREQSAQAHLLRDIFGNPFRPVAVEPTWLTADVVKLADTIYCERAFDRLPILADALEQAGCHNQEILSHCREPMPSLQLTEPRRRRWWPPRRPAQAPHEVVPHVRGCWVLDLIYLMRAV
jgi:hypothetical protein